MQQQNTLLPICSPCFNRNVLLFEFKLWFACASNYVNLAIISTLKAAVKLREKTKINLKFLAAKWVHPSMMQSWNAHCFIYIWAFLTTCHISQSHPPSVSSSFPASGLTWPRARGLCYVQPDVIPGSLVQQVNLTDKKCKKWSTLLLDLCSFSKARTDDKTGYLSLLLFFFSHQI